MSHLTPEQNERLRAAMRRTIEEQFRGTRSALAKAIGIKPPSLSEFLNGNSGASVATAELFAARVAHRPLKDIIGARKIGPVVTETRTPEELAGIIAAYYETFRAKVRAATIEECARVCDELGADECADAIRALTGRA